MSAPEATDVGRMTDVSGNPLRAGPTDTTSGGNALTFSDDVPPSGRWTVEQNERPPRPDEQQAVCARRSARTPATIERTTGCLSSPVSSSSTRSYGTWRRGYKALRRGPARS